MNSTALERDPQRNSSNNGSVTARDRDEEAVRVEHTSGNNHHSSEANMVISRQDVSTHAAGQHSDVSETFRLNHTRISDNRAQQAVPRVQVWSPSGGNVHSTTQVYQRGRVLPQRVVNVDETFTIVTRVHRFDGDSLNIHYELSNTQEDRSAYHVRHQPFTRENDVQTQSRVFGAMGDSVDLRRISERINNLFVRFKPEIEVDAGKEGGRVSVDTEVYQNGQRATDTGVRRDGEFVVVTRVQHLGDCHLRIRYHFRRV